MKGQIYATSGQNKKGFTLFLFLLLGLAISIAFFSANLEHRLVFQLLVYLFGGGVIWVSVRYFFSAFIYEITCLEGEWLLLVAAKQGKRYTTLCRMPLSQMVGLTPLTSPDKIEKPKGKVSQVHRFRQNMFPEAICLCRFDDGETTTEIELEPNEEFWQALSYFLKQNQDCEDQSNG